jgi:hypothetical protein
MTRMELGPDVPNHLRLRADIHPALGHLAGAPVNDLVPLLLGVRIYGVVETCNELMDKERPVLFRQRQHFGHFFNGNAHVAKISAKSSDLASS